jgi:trimeric autotransporter adhesin
VSVLTHWQRTADRSCAAAMSLRVAICIVSGCSSNAPASPPHSRANSNTAQHASDVPDAAAAADAADGGGTDSAAGAGGQASVQGAAGSAAGACTVDGAMTCAGATSRVRFICQNSLWVSAPPCAMTERCAMPQGDCEAVDPACVGHATGVAFCDGSQRRVCDGGGNSSVLPCGTNERCLFTKGTADCSCMPGTVDTGSGCNFAADCSAARGGCDPLTTCSVSAGQRTCGSCPAGYAGDGLTGCQPLLTSVTLSCGQLTPALTPGVHDYRIQVSLTCQQLNVHFEVPADTQIDVNGSALAPGTDWTSDALALGDTAIRVTTTSTFGVNAEYNWVVTRAGTEEVYIKAGNPAAADGFGASVALDGDNLLVGAPWQDGAKGGVNALRMSSGANDSGAAYLFTRTGTTWSEQAYFKADAPAAGDYFGSDVAILDDVIVIGAPRTDPTGASGAPPRAGVAYVFVRGSDGSWSQQARLSAQDGAAGNLFGLRLALRKDLLLIGATAEKLAGQSSGAVYVFSRAANAWQATQTLTAAKPIADSAFGSALALDGDTLAIGAQKDPSSAAAAGSAYVFTQQGGAWTQQQRIEPTTPSAGATFGWSVAVQGDTLVVGAPRATVSLTAPSGQAYVFERTSGHWQQTLVLQAPVPRITDYFGVDLVLMPTGLLIGASGDGSGARGLQGDAKNNTAPQSGALYLYSRQKDQFAMSTYIKASNSEPRDAFGISIAWSGDTIVAGANFESRQASGVNGTPTGMTLMNSGAAYVIH